MHAGRGVASNHYLLDTYQKTLEGYFRMWHHHFEFLLLGYGAYLTFFGFCKKAFPEITDQTIARMVAGIEAEIFRPDDELRRLARRAVRAGRRRARSRTAPACDSDPAVAASSRASRARVARGAGDLARIPGSTSTSAMASITTTAPGTTTCRCRSPALPELHPAACRPASPSSAPVEQLQAERTQLIADYRELLGTDEERAAFDQMITLAHRVFPYVEGHKFYCEHWYTNLFFNKIREFGALLAAHGFFADAEDVFQLTHYELEIGDHRPDEFLVQRLAAARAGALAGDRGRARAPRSREWAKHDTPPALGPVPDVIDDPAIVMLWGITRESLDAWLQRRRRRGQQRAAGDSPLRAAWSKARRAS